MNNALRHGLGAFAGVLLVPVLPWLLGASFAELLAGTMRLSITLPGTVLPVLGIAVGAVLIGIASAPRVSPLASLIPAVVFLAYGAAVLVALAAMQEALFFSVDPLWMSIGPGFYVLAGGLLLTASVWPSRWRRAPAPQAAAPAPAYGAPPAGAPQPGHAPFPGGPGGPGAPPR